MLLSVWGGRFILYFRGFLNVLTVTFRIHLLLLSSYLLTYLPFFFHPPYLTILLSFLLTSISLSYFLTFLTSFIHLLTLLPHYLYPFILILISSILLTVNLFSLLYVYDDDKEMRYSCYDRIFIMTIDLIASRIKTSHNPFK